MSNRLQRDFTQGSIPRHLIMFSAPMFAGTLLQALYSTVDSIWVGRLLGARALGAVSISFPLVMALLSLVMGLTMASSTLISQYRGAQNELMVKKTVGTSIILLGVLGTALSIIGVVFRHPLLSLVAVPPELRDMAASYFGIFMGGLMGMFAYNVLSAVLRGLGDSRTPLKFLFIATLVNVVLDPILIYGYGPIPQMGVAGAAWATIISQGMSAVLLWRWVRKHTDLMPEERAHWAVDLSIVKHIFRIGLPTSAQQVLISFGMVVVTAIISSFGPDVVAAFGAAGRLDQFGFMPAMAVGMAITSMVGQNLGAGRVDRVAAAVRWSALLAGGTTALISAVAVLKPTILMVLFTDDPGVLTLGSEYLRIMGFAYIPFALIFVLGGAMRGAGDTLVPMVMALIALWGIRVPLVWYLARDIGIRGIWWGILISATIGFVLHWGYYATGRWKNKVVARRAPSPEPSTAD